MVYLLVPQNQAKDSPKYDDPDDMLGLLF